MFMTFAPSKKSETPLITFGQIVRPWKSSSLIFCLLVCLVSTLVATTAADAKRVALVVGNGTYKHAPAVMNSTSDSTDISTALRAIGFTVVEKTNLTENEMEIAVSEFADEAVGAEMALFYYAGHGIELNKQNYLIPVDATLKTERQLLFETIPLDNILAALNGTSGIKLIFLDACRNNPFRTKLKVTNATRSIGTGLSRVDAPDGTVVSFSAEEGKEAGDGIGRNSPFASALLKYINEPGLELQFFLRKVRDEVRITTGGKQLPFISASLPSEPIYLTPPTKAVTVDDAQKSSDGSGLSTGQQSEIARDYALTERIGTVDAWNAYLLRYRKAEDESSLFYISLAKAALSKSREALTSANLIFSIPEREVNRTSAVTPSIARVIELVPESTVRVIEGELIVPESLDTVRKPQLKNSIASTPKESVKKSSAHENKSKREKQSSGKAPNRRAERKKAAIRDVGSTRNTEASQTDKTQRPLKPKVEQDSRQHSKNCMRLSGSEQKSVLCSRFPKAADIGGQGSPVGGAGGGNTDGGGGGGKGGGGKGGGDGK